VICAPLPTPDAPTLRRQLSIASSALLLSRGCDSPRAKHAPQAAAAEDSAKLQAKAEDARKAADDHAAQFRAIAQDTSEQAEAHWNELQSSWDQHIQHVRQRIAAKKAEHDSAAADSDAEWAEADAVNAVDFAEAAVVEAEYAVLDAALARTKADAMASS
jgi:Skp family chaperone for outer membrane proteins